MTTSAPDPTGSPTPVDPPAAPAPGTGGERSGGVPGEAPPVSGSPLPPPNPTPMQPPAPEPPAVPSTGNQNPTMPQIDAPPPAPPTPPAPPASAPRSDPEARIRELQGTADRLRSDLLRAQTRAQTAETALREAQGERSRLLAESTSATQAAVEDRDRVKGELDVAQGELAKLRLLRERPELLPYADIIPATADEAELTRQIDALDAARKRDLQALNAGGYAATAAAAGQAGARSPYGAGGALAPARGAPGAGAPMSEQDIKAYLEGTKDPVEFRRRVAEVAAGVAGQNGSS
jgi:hypothetical protein